jgi:asparagine synthase (glutamine-hydrolysing)
MCGICCVVGIESREESGAIVRRMTDAMVHRGPDEEGTLWAPPVAAGVRRLSIIDRAGGSQPVWDESGTLAVMFNGEIYNFRQLRQQLAAAGHQFRTNSDTEVIVHAYEAWGEECVKHLRGMFAFAAVETPAGRDGRAAHVFLARDRLGIKPLYYALPDGALLVASEVRALLASGRIEARLAAASIPSYLSFGSVGEPLTMVEGVFSLPPGHSLGVSVDRPMQAPPPVPYWEPLRIRHDRRSWVAGREAQSTSDPAKRVRALLDGAVASHLVADVPVGVFLSSGIDSTAIAALASRAQSGIHTFTVGFPDAEFSEAEKARRTAERFGARHSEFKLSDSEMIRRLDEAIGAFDQPSMDGINTYFVSWAARQAGLRVALSGLGSDELFGGYTSFRATAKLARIADLARVTPRRVRSLAAAAVARAGVFRSSPDASRKALAAWLDPQIFPDAYYFTRLLFTPGRFDSEPAAVPEWNELPWHQWLRESVAQARQLDRFTRVSWLELRSYLASTLLRDTDAMSMRNSLEVRVPFLESALVEYVLSLPESAKAFSQPKSLLVAALGDLLPWEIVRQTKRTFTFPWERWLRGELGNRVAAGLADWSPLLESFVGAPSVAQVWQDFRRGRTSWSRPWALYVLNEWVKRNLASIAPRTEHPKAARASVA